MSTALPAAFTPASLDYVALLPVLIVFGAAMLGVLVEAFLPRSARYAVHVGITLVGLVAAMGALAFGAVSHRVATAGLAGVGGAVKGSVIIDGPTLFLQATILLFALLAALSLAERFGGWGPMPLPRWVLPRRARLRRLRLARSGR